MKSGNLFRWWTPALIVFAVWHAAAADGPKDEAAVQELIRSLDTRADASDSPAPYNEQLRLLAHVYGGLYEETYFDAVLDGIEEQGDASSLPALESLLNRDIWRAGSKSPVNMLVKRYHKRASELWYEIRWKDESLSTRQKAATAMYGLRPDTPLFVDFSTAADRLRMLGADARPVLYEFLMAQEVDYEAYPWTVNAVTRLSDVLADERFAPTRDEQKQILGGTNLFARIALIGHYAGTNDPQGPDALEAWLTSVGLEQPKLLVHGLIYAAQMKALPLDQRKQLAEFVQQLAAEAWARFLERGKVSAPEGALIYNLNHTMFKLAVKPAGKPYFKDYRRFRDELRKRDIPKPRVVPWEQAPELVFMLYHADEWADMAGELWGRD